MSVPHRLHSLTRRLRDVDDDVRAVAAAALTPITNTLAEQLPYQDLSRVVDILWDCLAEGGDELGSSTGAVMDLLGRRTSAWLSSNYSDHIQELWFHMLKSSMSWQRRHAAKGSELATS